MILANPVGALSGRATDFTTWLDRDGLPLDYPHKSVWLQANAAVAVGQLVSFVNPTASTPLRVTPTGIADNVLIQVGIAKTAATAAGQMVEVVTEGFCLALVEAATTPTVGAGVKNGGTTVGSVTTDTPDATDIVGSILGSFLGAKLTSFLGSAHYAPVWLRRV